MELMCSHDWYSITSLMQEKTRTNNKYLHTVKYDQKHTRGSDEAVQVSGPQITRLECVELADLLVFTSSHHLFFQLNNGDRTYGGIWEAFTCNCECGIFEKVVHGAWSYTKKHH